MGIKWLDDWLADPGDPLKILADWVRAKAAVLVEIENTQVRFQSSISLGGNSAVLIAKPDGLTACLEAGRHVRVRRGGADRRELRLKVSVAHLNLTNGNSAFVCRQPDSISRCRRKSERFDVSRFTNLHVVVAEEKYRIGVISRTGFKLLLAGMQHPQSFSIGQDLQNVRLDIGDRGSIGLLRVTPRAHNGRAVGCEFVVREDDRSAGRLMLLLESLTRTTAIRVGA